MTWMCWLAMYSISSRLKSSHYGLDRWSTSLAGSPNSALFFCSLFCWFLFIVSVFLSPDNIGLIVSVSEIAYVRLPSNQNTRAKKVISLKHLRNDQISLVMWGSRAIDFDADGIHSIGQKSPVIVIFVDTLPKLTRNRPNCFEWRISFQNGISMKKFLRLRHSLTGCMMFIPRLNGYLQVNNNSEPLSGKKLWKKKLL